MWAEANRSAERLARELGKVSIAGSDSHTLAGVGLDATRKSPEPALWKSFLTGLRAGRGVVHGEHGGY